METLAQGLERTESKCEGENCDGNCEFGCNKATTTCKANHQHDSECWNYPEPTPREMINGIRLRYLRKEITREQARAEAEPHIKKVNEAMARVAKRHGKHPPKVSFISLMR